MPATMATDAPLSLALQGKKGLVIGIANEQSIAWGCAKAFHAAGATLACTYLNEKAEKFVRPLAEQVNSEIIIKCDVQKPGELEAVYQEIESKWGELDFILHAIAFAKASDLHGRVVDCSLEGWTLAMDVSAHSFIRMCKLAEPLMKNGGTCLTLSYLGAVKVVPNYGMMGPVKAALESVTRALAVDLGPKRIRVNAISAGAISTRAASGIANFSDMQKLYKERSPLPDLATQEDIGAMAAFLCSEGGRAVTAQTVYVDAGFEAVV
ncbi:enoyl-reductase [Hyaloraphidium curvatum]|nr:enoyl-reductase [Hyaloraphidium curvatum]